MQHPASTQPPQAKPPRERLWTAPFLACGLVNGLQGMAHFVMLTILPLVIIDSFRKGDLDPWEHLSNMQVKLYLMEADGGNRRLLMDFFGGQGSINVNSWAPDSRRFAFVRYILHHS